MSKTIAIMQPYFMPYIGYWQLMALVDVFVIYDKIQYTKKGWINRNRFLKNGKPEYFTLPLKKGPSILNINDRYLSDDFEKDREKMLKQIKEAYRAAPFFKETFKLFEKCLTYNQKNLFNFIYNSILILKKYLGIKTTIIISSSIEMNHSLMSVDKVIEICRVLDIKNYINPIGGLELYSKGNFSNKGINLSFHKSLLFEYKQFNNVFQPWLSIIDILMFNSKEQVLALLNEYELV